MTAFELAQRFVGELREIPGTESEPFIQWCLTKCGFAPNTPDEMPWCSAFLNGVCWLLRLPRSKSAMARSWLSVGQAVPLNDAVVGFDVVILTRGNVPVSDNVTDLPGHVGLFAGLDNINGKVLVLGGNQSDAVTVAAFPQSQVLGVRRLKT